MSEKQKPTSDPFPHLPRRPLFTETSTIIDHYGHNDRGFASVKPPITVVTQLGQRANVFKSGEGYVATVVTVAPVVDKTTTVKELREEVAKVENRGRGRPKSEGVKPWDAEGVSRAVWYRRKNDGK